MDEQSSLIWEIILYEFKQGHNTTKVIKNICCVKGENTLYHSTVFKKFF